MEGIRGRRVWFLGLLFWVLVFWALGPFEYFRVFRYLTDLPVGLVLCLAFGWVLAGLVGRFRAFKLERIPLMSSAGFGRFWCLEPCRMRST